MALFKERLKQLRNQANLSQAELAGRIGVHKQTISQYELGKRHPDYEILNSLCDFFNVSVDYILGNSNYTPRLLNDDERRLLDSGGTRKLPVLGSVAAGVPAEAIEVVNEYVEIPLSWDGEYGALVVKGDSMEPVIREGDIIIFRKQPSAQSGDLVVAMIDDEAATVKKLIKSRKGITLVPFNTAYKEIFFDKVSASRVKILGRVVENRQRF